MLDFERLLMSLPVFLTGLCFGSFLNVIVHRLPRGGSLIRPPSSCPHCASRLGIVELIPVFNYLALKGRCRNCRARISVRYPLIELSTGVLFSSIYLHRGLSLELFIFCTLFYILFGAALIDWQYHIIPNRMVAAGLVAGFIFYLPRLFSPVIPVPQFLISELSFFKAFAGMLIGGGVMLAIYLVSRGGMGAGDIKLAALIGLYVGIYGSAAIIFLGFLFGSAAGVFYMATGKKTGKDVLPFAPFLSLAAAVHLLWGEQIWGWYMNLALRFYFGL